MRSARTPIPASAIGLAVCLSLLAAPPASLRAAATSDAAARLAPARRGVHELVENLREAVRRLRVRTSLLRRPAAQRLDAAARSPRRPAAAFDRAAPLPLTTSLARLLNLPPPAA